MSQFQSQYCHSLLIRPWACYCIIEPPFSHPSEGEMIPVALHSCEKPIHNAWCSSYCCEPTWSKLSGLKQQQFTVPMDLILSRALEGEFILAPPGKSQGCSPGADLSLPRWVALSWPLFWLLVPPPVKHLCRAVWVSSQHGGWIPRISISRNRR